MTPIKKATFRYTVARDSNEERVYGHSPTNAVELLAMDNVYYEQKRVSSLGVDGTPEEICSRLN